MFVNNFVTINGKELIFDFWSMEISGFAGYIAII